MRPLFVLIAPSGAGKTTLLHGVLAKGLPLRRLVTATTRPPRENEVDGRDYHFLSVEEFEKRKATNAFVEWSAHYGAYYGLPLDELTRDSNTSGIVILDINGAASIMHRYSNVVRIFIAPPSREVLQARLAVREESTFALGEREARLDAEFEAAKSYDYTVVNDEALRATEELADIIQTCLSKD